MPDTNPESNPAAVLRGRVRYEESWQSLGECFICEEEREDIITRRRYWETVRVYFIIRGRINWDIIRVLRNWQRDYIPYYFE